MAQAEEHAADHAAERAQLIQNPQRAADENGRPGFWSGIFLAPFAMPPISRRAPSSQPIEKWWAERLAADLQNGPA